MGLLLRAGTQHYKVSVDMPQENSDPAHSLEKILLLERSLGHSDKAVTCGLEAFVRSNVPSAGSIVAGYGSASPAKRREMVDRLIAHLGDGRNSATAADPSNEIGVPIRHAKGVGPKRAALLAKLGIETIEDLLFYFPRRLEDRSAVAPIGSVQPGQEVSVRGEVQAVGQQRRGRRNMTVTKAAIGDGTGFLYAVWFNQPWIVDQLKRGDRVDLYGKVERNYGELQMRAPTWEKAGAGVETGRWVPVYPATEGVSDRYLRSLIHRNLDTYLPSIDDVLPDPIREQHGLVPRRAAVEAIHRPPDPELFERARRTLAFEELLLLQVGLAPTERDVPGRAREPRSGLLDSFLAGLSYRLTGAQRTALAEISSDLRRPIRMMRLLQGDVGSGKTLVAIAAALLAIDAGCQVAFMVPTEILAEQHAASLTSLLADLPVRVEVLTGATRGKDEIRHSVEDGDVDVLIGTHALIQESVGFRDLGLVVIDEQHRFGVVQRSLIEEKGMDVDVLVMSATPIPRTITLTLYGEFDVSTLDELPLGSRSIETRWRPESGREAVYKTVAGYLADGRKGYVVLPLVEESEKVTAKAAVQVAEEMAARFPTIGVGLIHGRLSAAEKAEAMKRFRDGDTRLLVATTVIEVGIDILDADFMIIEHADRFGLSQLHQLRGRIGRSGQAADCTAIADAGTDDAMERLKAFETYSDGFAIAEEDLRIRGPGDLLGTQQHGFFTKLRAVNLFSDFDLMRAARDAAHELREDGFPSTLVDAAERRFGEAIRFLRV
jgi:ATP-dependent DNA helicase RecG